MGLKYNLIDQSNRSISLVQQSYKDLMDLRIVDSIVYKQYQLDSPHYDRGNPWKVGFSFYMNLNAI